MRTYDNEMHSAKKRLIMIEIEPKNYHTQNQQTTAKIKIFVQTWLAF
jgi:hypothetical protein